MDIKDHIITAWKTGLDHLVPLVIHTLVLAAVSAVTLGILAPAAFAGYAWSIHMLLTQKREPRAQDIFSQLSLFFPLLGFSILIFIITAIGVTLFILPGIVFVLIVGYTCLYMMPLMIDKKFGLIDAIKRSTAIVTTRPVSDHVVVFLIFYALTTVGGGSFIGFLLLQPFATLFLLSVYESSK
jgi:uncharacterized membrane protein